MTPNNLLLFRIYQYGFDFPEGVKEMVFPYQDGYAICLDIKLTEIQKRHEYFHALQHIINRDFIKKNVQKIGYATHKICSF